MHKRKGQVTIVLGGSLDFNITVASTAVELSFPLYAPVIIIMFLKNVDHMYSFLYMQVVKGLLGANESLEKKIQEVLQTRGLSLYD